MNAASSLAADPSRSALAAENDRFPYEIRQLNFGIGPKSTHRLLFTVRPGKVVVLRVRHLAQQPIEPA